MRAELTALTARWLDAGHPPTAVRMHILRGLPGDGTLLSTVPAACSGICSAGSHRRLSPPPSPGTPSPDRTPGPRLSRRLTGTREGEGPHIQPTLFRPVDDEDLCPGCAAFAVG
jgi:hypothetical protein